MLKKEPRETRPRDKKVYIDDGAKIGRQPVDEKIHIDDGPTIGIPKKKSPKTK